MANQRMVVSNGSKTLETEIDGQWSIGRVEAAGSLKEGVYKLHEALDVARTSRQQIAGTVVHSDKERVYQAVGGGQLVAYDRTAFSKEPPIGRYVIVNYDHGRAAIDVGRDVER